MQSGFDASPGLVMTSKFPRESRLIYSLTPMAVIIDGFLRCLPGHENIIHWPGFATCPDRRVHPNT